MLLVTDTFAEEIVLQAIKRAYEERRVKVQIVPEYELVDVKREEAHEGKRGHSRFYFRGWLPGGANLD